MAKKRKTVKRRMKAKKVVKKRPAKRRSSGRTVMVTQKNLHQITKMKDVEVFHALKTSRGDGVSPTYPEGKPRLICKEGAILTVHRASTNKDKLCARGVNVATEEWCRKWGNRHHWLVEFKPKDIACVPVNSDGKFRLFRCKVVRLVYSSTCRY